MVLSNGQIPMKNARFIECKHMLMDKMLLDCAAIFGSARCLLQLDFPYQDISWWSQAAAGH